MNPVLLKPQSEIGAQVVVQGRVVGNAKAADYQRMKPQLHGARARQLRAAVRRGRPRPGRRAPGSAAEINLRAGDIANMGFARAADVPVVLIGDIDRGGVIASLVGTKAVLPPDDARLIEGFIVNKFRGDPSLFDDGRARCAADRLARVRPRAVLRRRRPPAGRGCAGAGGGAGAKPARQGAHRRARLPRISNFDDFDPLRLEPDVELEVLAPGPAHPRRRRSRHSARLEGDDRRPRRVARGGLGHRPQGARAARRTRARHLRRLSDAGPRVADPHGIEGPPATCDGLGLLDVETELTGDKLLLEVDGHQHDGGAPFRGYEMHVGRTTGADCARADASGSPTAATMAPPAPTDASAAATSTGCSPTTRSAAPGWRASAPARAVELRRRWWSRRSTSSPQHLERHLDCDALLATARAPRLT